MYTHTHTHTHTPPSVNLSFAPHPIINNLGGGGISFQSFLVRRGGAKDPWALLLSYIPAPCRALNVLYDTYVCIKRFCIDGTTLPIF
jgi:hypothetical protein